MSYLVSNAAQFSNLKLSSVPTQASVEILELAVAERVDAVVEMNQPGVWVLGSAKEDERAIGMGVVIEYANQQGEPRWVAPPD